MQFIHTERAWLRGRELTRLLIPGLFIAAAPFASAQDCTTIRASVSSAGSPGTALSNVMSISFDGRFVGFLSYASNLVPGDTNGQPDGFVRDTLLGITERISLNDQGGQCNGGSGWVLVSDNGQFACFGTEATNVTPDDADTMVDFFVRDRVAATTTRITKRLPGKPATWPTEGANMSADGRFVVFHSLDGNFVPGDTNDRFDTFLWDRLTDSIERVSVGPNGEQGLGGDSGWASISDDGRFVAFQSTVQNWGLVPVVDIFQILVRDRQLQTTTLVSVGWTGQPSSGLCSLPDISGDGSVVVFNSNNADLTPFDTILGGEHVYARDLVKQETSILTLNKDGKKVLAGGSTFPHVSFDGRMVVFDRIANDLVAQDGNPFKDIFLHDRSTGVTTLVSKGDRDQFASGPGANCYYGVVSGDGRSVAWNSQDNKLVTPWSGFVDQVYLRTCDPDPAAVYCASIPNSLGCTPVVQLSGTSSASSATGHVIGAQKLASGSIGLLYYGTQGTLALPIAGFYQCVQPPILRTPAQFTGGPTAPVDCTGALNFDFNAWIAAGNDPGLVPGTVVYAQFWSRDPLAASKMHFSPATAFVVGP